MKALNDEGFEIGNLSLAKTPSLGVEQERGDSFAKRGGQQNGQ
jgi:hypothetical protein